MFLIKKTNETDFFRKGKPVNSMALFPIVPTFNGQCFYETIARNIAVINKYFNFRESIKNNIGKYLSLKQRSWVLFTYPMLLHREFVGFRNFHVSISYLKETFNTLWEKEPELLNETVYSRFRDNKNNVSHWVFNYWQYASGAFLQHRASFGKSIRLSDDTVLNICKTVSRHKCNVLCINDTEQIRDYCQVKKTLLTCFDKILPNKSKYEL